MQEKFLTLIVVFVLGLSNLWAEETPWPVPEDKETKVAPFTFNAASQKAGEEIYYKNCKSCHGDIGQSNMVPLDPLPKDFSIEQVANESDGSMYYKIVTGRGAMPSFKNTLSVNDTWNVISYIRTFHKNYKQPAPVSIEAFAGAVTLAMNWLADDNTLQVLVMGKEDEKDVPAEGVEIALYAERYFGQLKVGESKMTDKKGIVSFNFDDKLPGDSIGNLNIIAKVVDTDNYGEVSANGEFIAGEPTFKPGLTEKRAMWNVGRKAPWWVTIAYPGVVLVVLGTIAYILLLLKKVYDIGKQESE